MKRRQLIRLLGAAALVSSAFSMSAFAATRITHVSITSEADDDASMVDGEIVAPKFTSDSDQYEVVNWNATSDSGSYKSARTYEITLDAKSGYYFPDEDEINVTATGVTQIVRKDTDDEYSFTLRVKAYPYYKWKAPSITTRNISSFDTDSITWDKNGAPKVEYILEWTDQNGDERSRTGVSTSTSLSVSSYNKKYTGTNEDKQSSHVTGFAIRATGNAGDNNRTAPSEWAKAGDVDPDNYDFPTYDSWSEVVNSNVGGTVNSGSSSSSSNGGGTIANGAWVQSGPDWYYRQNNGSYASGWLWDGTNWYYMDGIGRMQAGWFFDGANWFYLNTAHDGTYGRMLTGWITVDGLQYYMNPVSDGTRGAMYVGWRTVDGRNRYFNEAHDGTYGRLLQ